MEDDKKIEEKVETPPQEPSQGKKERTRLEKLRHTKASIEAQISEEERENGIVTSNDEDDDKPLTKGDLKRIERDNAKKSALTMADSLPDDERSTVRELLETRIVPSGNPQKDYQTAVDLARSEKHRQIAEEAARKRNPPTRPSGGGAPSIVEDQFIPTELELAAAAMVGKKSPADIKAFVLKARARENR